MGWILAVGATCQEINGQIFIAHTLYARCYAWCGGGGGGGEDKKGFKAGLESSRSLVTQLQTLDTHAYRVAVMEDEGIYRDPTMSQTPCLGLLSYRVTLPQAPAFS